MSGDRPGWYGKLPSIGDFARRRLDDAFVETWDAWLSQGIAALQATRDDWLHAYLSSPSWRFLLMPGGQTGECAWVGVLVPSVDKVGRYFPFSLAAPLENLPTNGREAQALLSWLARLDETAVSAMQDEWQVELVETALGDIGLPPQCPAIPDAGLSAPQLQWRLEQPAALLPMLAQQASCAWTKASSGRTFWWSETPSSRLLSFAGLGGVEGVACLLADDPPPIDMQGTP